MNNLSKNSFFLVSGAGSGIGQAIATSLAKASPANRVILLGRNKQKLEAVRAELPNASEHRICVADLKDRKALHQGIRGLELDSVGLSGVIANAGLGGENVYGADDRWDEIIATNLTGTYALVNEALPYLRKSSEPFRHIVIVASVLARLGVPRYSAYCASKAGLLGLMRSFASEFAAEKILVNAVCPGWVKTDMAREGIEHLAETQGISYDACLKQQMSFVPLRKMSEPSELGSLISYLVSNQQTSITGQTIDINNGALMA